MPLDAISAIMTERSGMSETTEVFMVGSDNLMRSDSHLDPEQRSVVASFRNPKDGRVDTKSTTTALKKNQSGVHFETDYRGKETITSFTPVKIHENLNYCLIAKDDKEHALSVVTKLTFSSILFILASVIAASIISILFARSLVGEINKAVTFAQSVATGDLSTRLTSTKHDELGDLSSALDTMADSLQVKDDKINKNVSHVTRILQNVESASEVINENTGQLSSTTASLSQSTLEQAASLEEISSSIREIGIQTKATADHAQEVNEISSESQVAADKGNSHMNEMVESMKEISLSSEKISKIIKVIDDIAFQTNLLALNAAVEAARAGSHGKGFAVVAEEVRSLAGRSAKAAQETAGLIEQSNSNVTRGSAIAQRTAEALSDITARTKQVHTVINDIASLAQQQNSSISQVTAGLDEVDKATQQNAAHAEEMASSVTDLAQKSADLQRTLMDNDTAL